MNPECKSKNIQERCDSVGMCEDVVIMEAGVSVVFWH